MSKEITVYIHDYSKIWKSMEVEEFILNKANNILLRRNIRKLKKLYSCFSIIEKGTKTKAFNYQYLK